jgi:predicted ABC-type ATPase
VAHWPPAVVILSGPNGAGKSTLARELLAGVLGVSEFVDADVLARALPPSEAAAVAAGRAVLRRLDALTAARRSFGFETTLASRSLARGSGD